MIAYSACVFIYKLNYCKYKKIPLLQNICAARYSYSDTMQKNMSVARNPIYGWIPDLPDHRDKLYQELTAVAPSMLPSSVDLRPQDTPVQNQEQLGSCTANALAGNVDYLKKLWNLAGFLFITTNGSLSILCRKIQER